MSVRTLKNHTISGSPVSQSRVRASVYVQAPSSTTHLEICTSFTSSFDFGQVLSALPCQSAQFRPVVVSYRKPGRSVVIFRLFGFWRCRPVAVLASAFVVVPYNTCLRGSISSLFGLLDPSYSLFRAVYEAVAPLGYILKRLRDSTAKFFSSGPCKSNFSPASVDISAAMGAAEKAAGESIAPAPEVENRSDRNSLKDEKPVTKHKSRPEREAGFNDYFVGPSADEVKVLGVVN